MNLGLLLVRATLGLLMAAHGSQKLFGWFRGHGFSGTAGAFEALGFRPARFFVATEAGSEMVSGILMALGFLTPFAGAVMIALMIGAAVSVHWGHGLLATSDGIEIPLLYGVGGAALALTGPGTYSIDAALGLTASWSPELVWTLIVLGVVGGVAVVALRRTSPHVPAA